MNIKILDSKSFQIEKGDQTGRAVITFDGSSLNFLLEKGKESLEFSVPGEYEKGGITVQALETPEDGIYKGKVDFVCVTMEHIKCGVLGSEVFLKHDGLKDIEDIDILIMPQSDLESIKQAVSYFEPKKLAILSKIAGSALITLSELVKLFPNAEESSSIKIKDSDLTTVDGVKQLKAIYIK